ncbi:SDR family NAD(P)-dependent oxidoreductase [Limobrevibacterium gyesilva]|uniref:SDR family oxidoreductase n=1 Tax=Limobrevibacterium gyesilva TaxID=2991712 RepID=A0AA41YS66_9PROT|nr:SDR family NAD(P)-dependent oxidoreductase [Limobrevibacterium gyesilva]MCW3475540.1 SDR family oxidoreductase [Limobrevibacterium gyesilva]
MDIDVRGKRVVVAGGSRGIGRSIALGFAAAGAHVSICARGAAALEATRAELAAFGGTAHAAPCDLSSEAAIAGYIPQAAAALGGIDVLVNNATGYGRADDEASWEASLSVDLLAIVRASREALPFIAAARDGTIINIASGSGLNPSVRTPAYGAAKAAVIHYTRTQAAALAAKGIRVNCVAPGSIEFPGGSWDRRKTDDPALYGSILASIPAKRLGRPEEVANVVLFLASPLASWVTAQIISVNGGQGLVR